MPDHDDSQGTRIARSTRSPRSWAWLTMLALCVGGFPASCGSSDRSASNAKPGADGGQDVQADGTAGSAGHAGSGGTAAAAGSAGTGGSTLDAGPPDADFDAGTSTVLYASASGAGDACSLSEPCPLLTARDKVRTLNAGMTEDIVVALRGGTYLLDATFALGPEDSGTNGHRVVYQAYPGEAPILSGGKDVDGWTLYDAAKDIYRAQVPSSLRTRQLYVGGKRAQRARGLLNAPGFQKSASGYTAPDAALAAWSHPEDLEAVHLTYWKNFRCGVASVQGTAVEMRQPCWELAQLHQGFTMGVPTWFENALELLDIAGEWYHDTHAGFMYYKPHAGENMAAVEVIAPALETLVSVEGTLDEPVHDITLRGLTFSHATWLGPSTDAGYPALQAGYHWAGTAANPSHLPTPGNVTLRRAERVVLEANVFSRLGAYALALTYGCRDNRVEGNVFGDISSGAVRIGDVDRPSTADPREVATNNVVRNNVVEDTGQDLFDGVGIFAGYTDGTRIEHNELRNLSYTAISVGWGWSTATTVAQNNHVAFNRASHVMRRLADGGMTYTLSRQPASSITDNYFHDQIHDFGAIYLDQGTMHFSVLRNVISSAPYWFILQPVVAPPAQENVVRLNYTDTASEYCCGGLGCCTDINTVTDNTVVQPGAWPAQARWIMHRAGLEPSSLALRGAAFRVEAEDYAHGGEGVGYHDLTAGNAGNAHRTEDVDVYMCAHCSNDNTVGYTQSGEWLAYNVDAPLAGVFDFAFLVGTQDTTSAVTLWVDGAEAGTVALPNTGSYGSFAWATLAGVRMNAGPHRVRVIFTGGFNFDAFTLTVKAATCASQASGAPVAEATGSFDADGTPDALRVYANPPCWDVVGSAAGETMWLNGWGKGDRLLVGDFDGDGLDDVTLILQASATWHLALSRGNSFTPFSEALVGWGAAAQEVVGDVDGDGKADVVLMWLDGGQWRWHVARSLGWGFEQHPDALVGVDPGAGACAKDVDGNGAAEVVTLGTGQAKCANYDAATGQFSAPEDCAATCP